MYCTFAPSQHWSKKYFPVTFIRGMIFKRKYKLNAADVNTKLKIAIRSSIFCEPVLKALDCYIAECEKSGTV